MDLGRVTMGEMIMFLIPLPFVFFFFFRMIKSSKEHRLPPGPYPWPIVGNLFQMGKNAHIRLAEMAQIHGPLMSLRLGQKILVVGSSSVAASEILKTHDHVLSGGCPSVLLHGSTVHNMNLVQSSETGDGWRKVRNLYTSKIFSSKAMESRADMREKKVMEMVKYISSKGGENISIKDVMLVTATNIIGNTTLSMDLVDFEGNGIGASIKDSVRRLSLVGMQPQLADLYPVIGRWDINGYKKQVLQIIKQDLGTIWEDILQRKRNGSNISSDLKDFTDFLIEKDCTRQQINAMMQELFSAGTDTTAITTEWFVAELLKNQHVMQKVRDEVRTNIEGNEVKESDLVRLPFLEACLKETLRLHPPGPLLLPHRAMEACEVMGYTIPKDSQILVNVWAIGRDPKIWDDPLSYKPERFMGSKLSNYKGKDFEYLPFSAGRRMCPGEALASKIIRLVVASLLLNFDWFLVDNNMNPQDINMDEVLTITIDAVSKTKPSWNRNYKEFPGNTIVFNQKKCPSQNQSLAK